MLKFSILLYVLPKLAFYLYLCYTLLCRDNIYRYSIVGQLKNTL